MAALSSGGEHTLVANVVLALKSSWQRPATYHLPFAASRPDGLLHSRCTGFCSQEALAN
jgi:hypothetical protein